MARVDTGRKWSAIPARGEPAAALMVRVARMTRCEPTSPFLHVDFLREVLHMQPAGSATLALALESSRTAPCMALLLRRSRLGTWNAYTTQQMPMSFFSGESRQVEAADIKALFAALPGFAWLIRIQRYDERYLPAMGAPLKGLLEGNDLHQTVSIEVTGTFAEYWAARSAGLRRSIRSALAKLEARQLGVRLAVVRDAADMKEAIRQHGELEAMSWKGAAGTSLAQADADRQFYERVMHGFAERSGAMSFQLYLGGNLAASELTLVDSGTMVLLKTAYREDFAEFSPGRLLDYLAFQAIFRDRMALRIEYSTKASEDDKRWATDVRTIRQLNVYRSATLRSMAARLRPWAAAIRSWLRSASEGRPGRDDAQH